MWQQRCPASSSMLGGCNRAVRHVCVVSSGVRRAAGGVRSSPQVALDVCVPASRPGLGPHTPPAFTALCRMEEEGVPIKAYSVHPGFINTALRFD